MTPVETQAGPVCCHLRSKRYFFNEGEHLDGSNHCWCYLTMQVVGPDGRLVHPEACREARGCYCQGET